MSSRGWFAATFAAAALAVPAAAAPAPAAPAPAAPPAPAAWPAEAIPGTTGGQPPRTFAFDREGRALILFEAVDQQHSPQRFTGTAVRAPGGGWARTADVAGIGWGSAQALLYARTRALLVTRQVTRFGAFNRARFRLAWAPGRSDGTFSSLRPIDDSADVPSVAGTPAGDVLVAYARQGGSIVRVSERRAGGAFGGPRVLSASGASRPAVAMNARGDRVVAWFRGRRLEARVRRAGHGWGSVLTVARTARTANQSLRATIAPSGRVALAWMSTDIREDRPVALTTSVAVRPRDAGWRATMLQRGIVGANGALTADAPAIPVIDSRGELLVAYTGPAGGGVGVKLARVDSRARVVATTVLSGASTRATLDDAAAGPQARVVVTWAEHAPNDGAVRTFVSLRPGTGAFNAPQALTPDGEVGLVGSRAAFSPLTGQAVVVRPLVAGGTGALAAAVGG